MDTKQSTRKHVQQSFARVGMDESGKGDYFGPLVVVAVFVDQSIESQLRTLGVRDSKKLSDKRIIWMARKIKRISKYSVVQIGPKKYNELYQSIGNLNRLLAWAHARALENLLSTVSCEIAIADKFSNRSYLKNALLEKGREIELIQQPNAERDIAVAAASILARAEFLWQMKKLSKKAGLILPKGASDPDIVVIGKEIFAKGGTAKLREFAKLNFKTTKEITPGGFNNGTL